MLAISLSAVGAFALAAQTLLLREYMVVQGGSELSIGLFYGSWFFWIALASTLLSSWGSSNAGSSRSGASWLGERFGSLLALYPVALVLQILLVRGLRTLAGVSPTDVFAPGELALWTFVSNAPVSLLTGLVFPAGCWALAEARPSLKQSAAVGRVYTLESLGSFAGGAVVTWLVASRVPTLHVALGACGLLASAGLGWALSRRRRLEAASHAVLMLVAVSAIAGPWARAWGESSLRARLAATIPDAQLVAVADTPYQNAAVARLGSQVLLVSNGRLVASAPDRRAQAMRAALLMAQVPEAKRILLVGAGAQGLVRSLLVYPVEAITYVEPDERAFALYQPWLPELERQALSDPRVELAFTDGRRLIDRLRRQGARRFDLVALLLPDPDTAALNRYFTEELYRDVATLLAPGGAVATRIHSGENALRRAQVRYGASVDSTLRQVFAEVLVAPGEESWLFASPEHGVVSVDPEILAQRYRALALEPPPFPAEGFSSLVDPRRVEAVRRAYEREREREGDALVNRDQRPVTYFFQLAAMADRVASPLAGVLEAVRSAGPWLFLLPALFWLALRLHQRAAQWGGPGEGAARRFDAAVALFAFGAASIGLQIVLIDAYQSRFGVIFERIGLVAALFMAGLAIGAAAFQALAGRGRASPASRVAVLLLAMAALALAVPWWVGLLAAALPLPAEIGFAACFALSGVLSGAAFPAIGRLVEGRGLDSGRIGALVESADHWGAALGALLAGTIVIPVVGVADSSRLLAALLAIAGLTLVLGRGAALRRLSAGLRRLGLIRVPVPLDGRGPPGRVSSWGSIPGRGLSYLLFGIALSALVMGWLVRRETKPPGAYLDPQRLHAALRADRFQRRDEPFVHYRAFDRGSEEARELAFASLAVSDEVVGYGGPLNLLVVIDRQGTLRRVALVSSKETPAYVTELDGWLRRFEGKRATSPFVVVERGEVRSDHEVDLISGATISSRAAVDTLNLVTRRASEQLLGLEVAAAVDLPKSQLGPEALYLLLTLPLGAMVLWRAGRRLRLLMLAATLLVGGLLLNVQLSLAHLARLVDLDLPAASSLPLFSLLGGVAVLTILFGPAYCSSLCPFGAAQELIFGAAPALEREGGERRRLERWSARLSWLALALLLVDGAGPALLPDLSSRLLRDGALLALLLGATLLWLRWLRWSGPGVSSALHQRARYLKYVLLALVVAGYAVSASQRLLGIDPLALSFAGKLSASAFVLLALLLLLCARYFRFWCRYFCPLGALLNLGNRLRLAGAWLRPKRYADCDLGVRSRHDTDCIQCDRCLAPTGAGRCAASPVATPIRLRTTPGRGLRGAGHATSRSRGDRLFLVALGAVGLALLAQLVAGPAASESRAGVGGEVRDVDPQRIQQRIEQGRLSDHEAQHYRVLDGGAGQ